MSSPKIKIAEFHFSDAVLEEIRKVLDSGNLREGSYVRSFEEAAAKRMGVKHAIASSSGTSALHLSYLALLNAGDEIIVPSFTFISTASMAVMAGAKPVFCEVNPKTWTVSASDIEPLITPRTKAIGGVHLFGNTCEIGAIVELAKKHNLKLIWDAAQSFGTTYNNQDVGAIGDATCFSFYPTKNLTTGEGGMVTTNDDALAARLRQLKNHGETDRYQHEFIGTNYRMPEITGVLGLEQLRGADTALAARKKIAAQYEEYFATSDVFQTQAITPSCDSSYNYYSVLLNVKKLGIERNEWIKLLGEKGIPCSVHYPKPLHQQPCFSGLSAGALPVCEDLTNRIFALPLHPFLSDNDVSFILETIDKKTKDLLPA